MGEGGSLKEIMLNDIDLTNKDFSFRHKTILYLAALGCSAKEIAERVDIRVTSVSQVLKSETAKAEINRIQHEIFQKDPGRIFRNILPKAVDVAYTIMTDTNAKEQTRTDAAFKFMDRALGKPVQEIKQETTGLKEIFEKLEQLKSGKEVPETLEAEYTEVKEEKAPDDPLEKWMNENL